MNTTQRVVQACLPAPSPLNRAAHSPQLPERLRFSLHQNSLDRTYRCHAGPKPHARQSCWTPFPLHIVGRGYACR